MSTKDNDKLPLQMRDFQLHTKSVCPCEVPICDSEIKDMSFTICKKKDCSDDAREYLDFHEPDQSCRENDMLVLRF